MRGLRLALGDALVGASETACPDCGRYPDDEPEHAGGLTLREAREIVADGGVAALAERWGLGTEEGTLRRAGRLALGIGGRRAGRERIASDSQIVEAVARLGFREAARYLGYAYDGLRCAATERGLTPAIQARREELRAEALAALEAAMKEQ